MSALGYFLFVSVCMYFVAPKRVKMTYPPRDYTAVRLWFKNLFWSVAIVGILACVVFGIRALILG